MLLLDPHFTQWLFFIWMQECLIATLDSIVWVIPNLFCSLVIDVLMLRLIYQFKAFKVPNK